MSLGFRVSGFRGIGFMSSGFRVYDLRVQGSFGYKVLASEYTMSHHNSMEQQHHEQFRANA